MHWKPGKVKVGMGRWSLEGIGGGFMAAWVAEIGLVRTESCSAGWGVGHVLGPVPLDRNVP